MGGRIYAVTVNVIRHCRLHIFLEPKLTISRNVKELASSHTGRLSLWKDPSSSAPPAPHNRGLWSWSGSDSGENIFRSDGNSTPVVRPVACQITGCANQLIYRPSDKLVSNGHAMSVGWSIRLLHHLTFSRLAQVWPYTSIAHSSVQVLNHVLSSSNTINRKHRKEHVNHNTVTRQSRGLEKQIVTNVIKKVCSCYGFEDSLPCSQKLNTFHCPVRDESTSRTI